MVKAKQLLVVTVSQLLGHWGKPRRGLLLLL